jgi:hypothetical protein
MGAVKKDPYRVVMKQSRLPMSLLHDRVKVHVSTKQGRIHLITLVLSQYQHFDIDYFHIVEK